MYTSTQSPTQYTSSITHLQTDIYGNLKTVGASSMNASTAGINPVLIAGVNNVGTIEAFLSTGGTMGVDTELLLAADNVTISNIKTFVQTTGTQTFALVDSSTRILLSPSSTIITSNASTVNIPVTSTINFPVSSSVNIGITGTVGVLTPTDQNNTTGTIGVVRSHLTTTVSTIPISGTINLGTTTATIPVSFSTGSTVNIPISSTINFATSSTVNIASIAPQASTALGLVVSGGTIGVETEFAPSSTFNISPSSTVNFPVTSTVQIGTTGTVGVSIPTTSTLGAAVTIPTTSSMGVAASWATGSTMNVKWAQTSTLGAAVTGGVTLTGSGSTVQAQTPTNQTGTIPVVMATTSTIGAAVSFPVGSTLQVGNLAVDYIKTTGGTVESHLVTTTATIPVSGTVNLATSNATIPVSGTVSLGITNATIPTSFSTGSTVQNLYAGVGYTPVSKYIVFTAATALCSVWIPAATKKWYMTDLIISESTASIVSLIDTTTTLATFNFGDNGGLVSNFRTPLVATLTNGTLKIATSAGSCSFLVSGWEA